MTARLDERLARRRTRSGTFPQAFVAGYFLAGYSALLVAVLMSLVVPAVAQRGDLRSGRLNPFPASDTYRLHLVGDWFVGGLNASLAGALQPLPRVQVQTDVIELQSLRRSNWDAVVSTIRETASSTPIDMAVVMFGVGEVGSLYTPGRDRQRFGSEDWVKLYAERVDSVMSALKVSKGAVYWIGLPVVRRRDHSDGHQVINTLLRERAYANGVTYIDSYSRFLDENGGFDRYGPDLSGAIKLLRARDGIYFTAAGNDKLAHLVAQMIRRDLSTVRSERTVELAGDQDEQRSVRRTPALDRRRSQAEAGRTSPAGRSAAAVQARTTGFDTEKADNGSFVFETTVGGKASRIKLELPRPALSSAIMALVTRNQSKDRLSQHGDNAVFVADGGVPLLSTVSPADQTALALRRRRLSPTQSVFFKVWGRGERLDPRPGRADDFAWPRPQPEPVVHARAEPLSAAAGRARTPRDPNLPPLPVQNPFQ